MKITGFHIEPTNICTLKCAGCARTRFIDQWPQHWRNHSVDIDAVMQFIDVDLDGVLIELCGNYGDPIYHPRFIELVQRLKQRGAQISLITNGSYRTPEWWQELCSVLGAQDRIAFSIDGVPENFTQYRVNADWTSIEQGIRVCVTNGVNVTWKFIPFSFNEQDIDRARELSESLGMSAFQLDRSDRFDDKTQHLRPQDHLLGRRTQAHQEIQQGNRPRVDPRCHHGREHFITATGHYVSCCYVADHRFYYKTDFGKNQANYDIANTTLTQILNQPAVVSFYSEVVQNPPLVCQFNCPATRHG